MEEKRYHFIYSSAPEDAQSAFEIRFTSRELTGLEEAELFMRLLFPKQAPDEILGEMGIGAKDYSCGDAESFGHGSPRGMRGSVADVVAHAMAEDPGTEARYSVVNGHLSRKDGTTERNFVAARKAAGERAITVYAYRDDHAPGRREGRVTLRFGDGAPLPGKGESPHALWNSLTEELHPENDNVGKTHAELEAAAAGVLMQMPFRECGMVDPAAVKRKQEALAAGRE